MREPTVAVLQRMAEQRRLTAANSRAVLELLKPEWRRFMNGDGNFHVAEVYVDHKASLRAAEEELAALEEVVAGLVTLAEAA